MKILRTRSAEIIDHLWHGNGCNTTSVLILLAFLDAIVWAVCSQAYGHVPTVQSLNMIWFRWELPFIVTRLWDIFLFPSWLVAMGYITTSPRFQEREDVLDDSTGPLGTLLIIVLFASAVIGSIFGTPYAVLTATTLLGLCAFIYALVVIAGLIFCCGVSLICSLCDAVSERNKRRRRAIARPCQ